MQQYQVKPQRAQEAPTRSTTVMITVKIMFDKDNDTVQTVFVEEYKEPFKVYEDKDNIDNQRILKNIVNNLKELEDIKNGKK